MFLYRNCVTAFLMNKEDCLVIKRSMNKKLAPGFWAGIGGHLEPSEINNPMLACIREICEETRISEQDIDDLKLKYIILRKSSHEIMFNHIYFGNSRKREVNNTEEGSLHWINRNELMNLKFTASIKIMIKHYLEFATYDNEVYVGTVFLVDNQPTIYWANLDEVESSI